MALNGEGQLPAAVRTASRRLLHAALGLRIAVDVGQVDLARQAATDALQVLDGLEALQVHTPCVRPIAHNTQETPTTADDAKATPLVCESSERKPSCQ